MIPGDNRKISKVPSTAGLTVVEKRTLDLREGGRARVPSRPPFDTAKRFRDCALSACASLSRFHFALFAATLHLLSRKASRIDPVEGNRRGPPPPPLFSPFLFYTAISNHDIIYSSFVLQPDFPCCVLDSPTRWSHREKGSANESVVSA